MNQRSFASAEFAQKKKRTRREKFLAHMERSLVYSTRFCQTVPEVVINSV